MTSRIQSRFVANYNAVSTNEVLITRRIEYRHYLWYYTFSFSLFSSSLIT